MSPLPTSREGAAIVQPSASYSIVIRASLPSRAGAFGEVATTIGNTGAILGAIDLVKVEKGMKVRDITIACIDSAHGGRVVDAVREIDGVTVESVLDRTFQMHQGGKMRSTRTSRSRRATTLDGVYAGCCAHLLGIHEESSEHGR